MFLEEIKWYKKTWIDLYFSHMQGYESYVWNVLFSMDVYFPNLSCSLEAYNKFLRNFPHVYISGILLDRFYPFFGTFSIILWQNQKE